MPGPPPKDPALRQRTNKATTRATLPAAGSRRRAPQLPERAEGQAWHALTVAWWRDLWQSPMAAEFLKADHHALYLLADLIDRYWVAPNTTLAAEIRQQRMAFGLTPLDRRRLEWQVERTERATAKRPRPSASAEPVTDPRKLLAVV